MFDITSDPALEVAILCRLARASAIKKIAALNTGTFDNLELETR